MEAVKVKEFECTMAQAVVLLEALTEAGDAVMLWGTYGIGKSEIVYQLGVRKNRKVIDFRTNIREPVDLRGVPVPDHKTGTTKWFTPDELPRVDRDGEEGYLFLDEINSGSLQMQAVCFQLVQERKVGDYHLPTGWRIIAAGNRVGDRAAAQRMPTALRNRFAHLFCKPDVAAWCTWANANGVAPEVVAFVRLRQTVHVALNGDENCTLTPRSLFKASKYVNADRSIRLRLLAAHIGDGWAAELDGFLELYRSLGSLDDIVADPEGAKVPNEASCRYAVATGLARIATRKTFANIVTYAKRLPREQEVLCVTDATGRDDTLKNTPIYGKWAVDNQDIIVQ